MIDYCLAAFDLTFANECSSHDTHTVSWGEPMQMEEEMLMFEHRPSGGPHGARLGEEVKMEENG